MIFDKIFFQKSEQCSFYQENPGKYAWFGICCLVQSISWLNDEFKWPLLWTPTRQQDFKMLQFKRMTVGSDHQNHSFWGALKVVLKGVGLKAKFLIDRNELNHFPKKNCEDEKEERFWHMFCVNIWDCGNVLLSALEWFRTGSLGASWLAVWI